MMTFGRQAAFLATGGYHHDVGANTWASRGAPSAPDAMAHLEHVTFALPEGRAIEGLQARVAAAGIPARADAGVIEVTDPSGNRLIFRAAAEAQESATP
jgi:catechol 2,3-dioxygenase